MTKYDNMTPLEMKEALVAMEKSLNILTAGMIATIRLTKHQQLAIPRDFIIGSKKPQVHDKVYVSVVGTRYYFKVNDKRPGERPLVWTPPGARGDSFD